MAVSLCEGTLFGVMLKGNEKGDPPFQWNLTQLFVVVGGGAGEPLGKPIELGAEICGGYPIFKDGIETTNNNIPPHINPSRCLRPIQP